MKFQLTNLNWWAGFLNHQQYLHIPHLSLRKKPVFNLQGFAYNFCTTMVKTGAQRCVHVFGIFSWVKHVLNIGSWDNLLFALERLRFLKLTKKSVVYIWWLLLDDGARSSKDVFCHRHKPYDVRRVHLRLDCHGLEKRPAQKKVVID